MQLQTCYTIYVSKSYKKLNIVTRKYNKNIIKNILEKRYEIFILGLE